MVTCIHVVTYCRCYCAHKNEKYMNMTHLIVAKIVTIVCCEALRTCTTLK